LPQKVLDKERRVAADDRVDGRRVICRPEARAALLADLAERPRIEACGLLLGRHEAGAWIVEGAIPLRNTHNANDHFEFDPDELLRCDLEWGERIIGAYHSHPDGPARASRTDYRNMRALAESPWVWLILSPRGATPLGAPPGGDWRVAGVAAYRVEAGRLVRFPVEVPAEQGGDPPTDQ
jgi:proteasome lid subunit RPN8/RPN11